MKSEQTAIACTGVAETFDDGHVDFLSLQCAEKLRLPGWRWYAVDSRAVFGGTLITGLVPDVFLKSGKNKGEPNWKKCSRATERKLILTDAERTAFELRWERETGKCRCCFGTGKRWCGWGQAGGHRYRDCDRCGATGKAPATTTGDSVT